MLESYRDITSKLGYPEWFDEHGVPRYCAFHPRKCANKYADEAVLIKVRCQGCGEPFRVAITTSRLDRYMLDKKEFRPSLKSRIDNLHYGDPPNYGCCAVGPTMNSETVGVIEFWQYLNHLHTGDGWERRYDLENKSAS